MGRNGRNGLFDGSKLAECWNLSVCFSRTKAKADQLIESGANWVANPADLASGVDYVFSMVGYPEDVEEIYFGDAGLFSTLEKGTVMVDMTTSSPILAEKIATKALDKKCFSLDAPVSGGDIGAKSGTLAIMCGGNREAYDQVYPILEIIGSNIQYFGEAGAGQRVKMSNQILIATTMIGTVEALLYAEKANLNLKK